MANYDEKLIYKIDFILSFSGDGSLAQILNGVLK